MQQITIGRRDGESIQVGEAVITVRHLAGQGRRFTLTVEAPRSTRVNRIKKTPLDKQVTNLS
jgi:sRNA-binding carbon storage regulator CsrA